MGCLMSLSTIF